jgi:hypothetical protein
MVSNAEKAELLETAVADVPRAVQAIDVIITAEHGTRALEGVERNHQQDLRDLIYAEASPLKLYLSEDLFRYLRGEAERSDPFPQRRNHAPASA